MSLACIYFSERGCPCAIALNFDSLSNQYYTTFYIEQRNFLESFEPYFRDEVTCTVQNSLKDCTILDNYF